MCLITKEYCLDILKSSFLRKNMKHIVRLPDVLLKKISTNKTWTEHGLAECPFKKGEMI